MAPVMETETDHDEPPRVVTEAVVDSFDALTFDTPYRRGIPVDEALAELEKQPGEQFDPHVIRAFLQVREKVVEEMSRLESTVRFRQPEQIAKKHNLGSALPAVRGRDEMNTPGRALSLRLFR
jgi:hypothetical protein